MYCHYKRKSNKINKIIIKGKTKIEVLQDKVDYSSCRRDYDFSNVEFELDISCIFYIGTLKFIDGN